MPCLIILVAFGLPRLTLILLALFSDYLTRAYGALIWPLLGFFFAPYTTLAYAWAKNSHGSVDGFYLVAVILAVLVDIGAFGGGSRHTRTVMVRRKTT
jgi:hypothetical protein